jgi:hypothetical protein
MDDFIYDVNFQNKDKFLFLNIYSSFKYIYWCIYLLRTKLNTIFML